MSLTPLYVFKSSTVYHYPPDLFVLKTPVSILVMRWTSEFDPDKEDLFTTSNYINLYDSDLTTSTIEIIEKLLQT